MASGYHDASSGEKTYQGTALLSYTNDTIEWCKRQALSDLQRLTDNMLKRLEWSDMKLLRGLLVFLDTQSWMKRLSLATESDCEGEDDFDDPSLAEVKGAIKLIFVSFKDPLDARGVSLSVLLDEIEDTIDYTRIYLALECTDNRKVWYNLHVCPDSGKWPNVLLLCELTFSLPFSNG